MIIEEAKASQAKEISDLIKESVLFAHTGIYPEDKVENVLTMYKPEGVEGYMKEGKYFVAIEGGKIIGCILIIKEEMSSLYVLPEHIHKGIGTKLSQKAEADIKENNYPHVWIWSSLTAVDFYKSRGYKQESDITDKKGNTWYIGMKKVFG
ncbi:MAG: GNAT family N-acetyltransferase [Candidatus Dojkabacteria bacterium]|jgi:N-acetylglutamate synthase-like GNAT family acetyltransferase|nr:GNAT family N-acetyltransferase [Candidatus Dojkabacteria bacterium]